MSYSSLVTIEELSSAGGSTKRTVTLVGPSLPFMGAEWSGENTLITTWYPGNPDEGTQQNLGPKELPSDWQGAWHRTMMGRCPTMCTTPGQQYQNVVDPSTLRDILESIFRDGRRLRVTWSTTDTGNGIPNETPISGSIVREGRVKSWKFKHRTIHDIEWNITFEWVSRGVSTPRVSSTRNTTISKASTSYVSALQKLVDRLNAALNQSVAPSAKTLGNLESVKPSWLDDMMSTSTKVATLRDGLNGIVGIGASLPQQPIQLAQMAMAHATDAQSSADATYTRYSAVPAEQMSQNPDAVSVLRAYGLISPVADAAQQTLIESYVFYRSMRSTVPTQSWSLVGRSTNASNPDPASTILAICTVHDGDTPQKLSMRYYKTPDHAADIMRANGLSWHTTSLPKGKHLVIPVIASSTQVV